MDDIPLKYILDNHNKDISTVNDIGNNLIYRNEREILFEKANAVSTDSKYIENQRSFLQDNFKILNPPNI
jgi:hypothetical protein